MREDRFWGSSQYTWLPLMHRLLGSAAACGAEEESLLPELPERLWIRNLNFFLPEVRPTQQTRRITHGKIRKI